MMEKTKNLFSIRLMSQEDGILKEISLDNKNTINIFNNDNCDYWPKNIVIEKEFDEAIEIINEYKTTILNSINEMETKINKKFSGIYYREVDLTVIDNSTITNTLTDLFHSSELIENNLSPTQKEELINKTSIILKEIIIKNG